MSAWPYLAEHTRDGPYLFGFMQPSRAVDAPEKPRLCLHSSSDQSTSSNAAWCQSNLDVIHLIPLYCPGNNQKRNTQH